MKTVDFNNRWVYKGSRTMPPCGRYTYWNIVQKVYPIKPEILAKLVAQMETVNSSGQDVSRN